MIIVRIYEGLGNQLFQYAYARALGLSTNQKVFLDVRETGKGANESNLTPRQYSLNHYKIALPVCINVHRFYPYLNGSDEQLELMQKLSAMGCLPYRYYKAETADYNDSLVHMKGNWYLQGWFQDSRYFQKHESIIKREIVPRHKIRISSGLRTVLQMADTVSVHIRRRDYKRLSNTLPANYYYNAMMQMKSVISNPFWVIFSDEIEWVKKNIDFGNNCYFLDRTEGLEDYEELMVMSCCKNHIIANSTYSWWGHGLIKTIKKL